MDLLPSTQIQKGTLLIASPDLESGLFFRGVILVCEHTPAGSFGLLMNKSLDIELPEEILNVQEIANPRVQLRAGGPIQTNQMMLLHSSNAIEQETLQICDGVFLGGDLK